MKKKWTSIIIIMITGCMLVALTGCGSGNGTATQGGTLEQDQAVMSEQDSTAEDISDAGSAEADPVTDGILGEWQFMCSIYHSEDSDGYFYDDVTMCTDENSPESSVIIRKENDAYLADYLHNEYESHTMIYGAELTYSDSAAYSGADNQSWCMEIAYPFDDESSDETWKKFSLTGDDRLIVSSEYSGEPDEEGFSYSSLSTDIYLRKGSPEFDDPENLRYFDTVTVSNAVDLLNSIQNNRKIIVESGVYNFTEIVQREIDNNRITDLHGAYQVNNVSNLCIEAKDDADAQFCIDDPYGPVFSFEGGRNITIRGITAGHTVEPGYCSGSVLYFNNVSGIDVDHCRLYGSGTYGVEAQSSYSINVTDTDIYECTYGLVSLHDVGSVVFKNCTMRDSCDLSMIETDSAYDVLFEDCEFTGNRADAYDSVYFVEIGEYDHVSFKNCSFKDNVFNAFSNREVTLENCTSDNNHAAFSDMIHSSVSGEPLDTASILSKYEETLGRQQEIDAKLQSDALLDQLTLNQLAYEEYDMWDALLNQVWTYLEENLDTESMDELREEQKKWIREKESSMKEATTGFEGGSMQPMVEYGNGASQTQKRVEELLEQYIKA